MTAVFHDLKVIDAASFLAGPGAATIFADYGADVVKVEPLNGDRFRTTAGGHPSDFTWQLTNRSKRCLALDITQPEGYAALLKMVSQADIFLVNFNTEQMEKYKLDWPTLEAINPRLIFAQITAYGLKGADANRRAYDLTGWFARTGIMDLLREKDIPPSFPVGGVGDHATAMTLFGAIMLALYKRDRTGVGSMVSTSLVANGAWANGLNLQAAMAGIDAAERRDKEGWSNPLQNVYTMRDGRHILVVIQNIFRDWPKLVECLEEPEWLADENLQPIKPLFRNRFKARELIAQAMLKFDTPEMCRRLEQQGIVYSKVAQLAEVIRDPQLLENDLIVPSESGIPGIEQTLATPFQVSNESQMPPQRAPRVGEQSRQVLNNYGFSPEEIKKLIDDGVVTQLEP